MGGLPTKSKRGSKYILFFMLPTTFLPTRTVFFRRLSCPSASLYHRTYRFEQCPGQWLSSWTVVSNWPVSWKMTSLTLVQSSWQWKVSLYYNSLLQSHRTKASNAIWLMTLKLWISENQGYLYYLLVLAFFSTENFLNVFNYI